MTTHRWSAACFDLDGTLTDPKPGITACIRHALQRLGRTPPPADDLTWCIGPPLLASFETLLGDRELAPRALALYRERFGAVGLFENRVYDGIPATLAACRQAGLRLFVATSKPTVYATRIAAHFSFDRHFEAVCGSELDGTRTDKSALLAWVLARHGLDPARTVMIGDRHHDMVGARNNGMAGLGVAYGYGSRAELADAGAFRIVTDPAAIPDALADAQADDPL
ncbi:MAG: HAD family hydrolase [Alphaproteobacteria bacterium]|nr:HAD family hydrolase [Alphaproteobacteria bacterium]MCB9928564.1 HAD family hydrolase [Alphaproteobacteria bacterium]